MTSTTCEACSVNDCDNCDDSKTKCKICNGVKTPSKSSTFCVDKIDYCEEYED